MAKAKRKTGVKVNDVIEWPDIKTKETMRGTVRKILENSVIVDIEGEDYEATVVSHRRYEIIEKAEGEVVEKVKQHPLRRTFPSNNTKKLMVK